MFTISDLPTALPGIELADSAAEASATIVPTRGGMATHFVALGREWLFLDESTLLDPHKNVRGGIPILFPSPGKLAGDAFERGGRAGRMGQHGFARNLAWKERARSTEGAARLELELADSDSTRAAFPWPFRLRLAYSLRGATLRLEVAVENPGAEALPFAFGLHPYFAVSQADKAKASIPTRATAGWDNVAKKQVGVSAIDLCAPETDLHLLDHGGSEAELRTPQGTVRVRGSEAFSRWVVWQLAGRDFVCLEPWTAPGNALNTGEGLLFVPPGDRRELWVELSVAR